MIDPKSPVFEERSFVVIRKDWIENNKLMIADLHFIDCYQFKGEKFFGGNDKIFALFSVKNKQDKLSADDINVGLNKAEILPFDNCFVS